jgi:hypothetical protein
VLVTEDEEVDRDARVAEGLAKPHEPRPTPLVLGLDHE